MKSDHALLSQLAEAVTFTKAAYKRLEEEHCALQAELQQAEEERAALAGEFATRAAALSDLEARCADVCAAGRDLQGRLDDAARQHATMAVDLVAARSGLADKVGAGGGRAGRCSAGCWWCRAGMRPAVGGCWGQRREAPTSAAFVITTVPLPPQKNTLHPNRLSWLRQQ